MPKVIIDDTKGLYQKAGSGLTANGNCQLKRGPLELVQVADPANDTTITKLASGYEYHIGTTTGIYLASNGDNDWNFHFI